MPGMGLHVPLSSEWEAAGNNAAKQAIKDKKNLTKKWEKEAMALPRLTKGRQAKGLT
jgi:hypothetical protein